VNWSPILERENQVLAATIDTETTLRVPFMDLRPQNEEVRAELAEVVSGIIDDSAFIGGEYLARFEQAFAEFVGVEHAVGVGSGTDALRIALQAVGVRPGDAVLTVSHSFIATAEAVTQVGATPVFVDIEAESQTMSPSDLDRVIREQCERMDGGLVLRESGSRVSAIVPVHLYGQSADMAAILELADAVGVPVVEDACQAHGATCRFPDGREVGCGAMGRAAAFSFYPGKNLGAMGEAGALTTNDDEVARRARMLRDHGQSEKYVHVTAEGSNARMDAIQAAVLGLKLPYIAGWNERRRELARRYDARLREAGIALAGDVGRGRHVYHLYIVRVADREAVRERLGAAGVQTGLHYPIPIHLQEAYEHLGYGPGSLPVTEAAAESVLSLPMYPHMTDEMVDHAADRLVRSVGG